MVNVQKGYPASESCQLARAGRFVAALPEVVSDVAGATTRPDAAARIARSFVFALGACTARVYLAYGEARALHLAAAENVDPSTLSAETTIALDDDSPLAIAARSGLIQLMDGNDRVTPGRESIGAGVALALPLFAGLRTIGLVIAGFDELAPRDCMALESMSHALGALLDRARLEDEVQRLEAALRTRSRHAEMIVHDLTQPLTSVILSAAHLAKASEARERPFIERIRTCAGHLERMFADLRDASLLESGQVTLVLEETDIVELVSNVVREHEAAAELVIEGDIPRLTIDSQRVEQVLVNILVNAKKYGQPASTPRVEIARQKERVVVSITNEGEVIPAHERMHLFDAHYRGRKSASGGAGLGLGLYICKKLVEEHGGHIWTEGAEPGNRFSFSLPLPASALATALRSDLPSPHPRVDEPWTLDA